MEKVKLVTLLKDERTRKIVGALLLLIGVLLFISFVSYLFTWRDDYSLIQKGSSVLFDTDNQQPVNSLGAAGAYFSDLFFRRWVGISSFLICLFFFTTGINLLSTKKLFSVWKNIRYVVLGTILLSVTASFIANPLAANGSNAPAFFWGGQLGDGLNMKLQHTLGRIGTGLVIFVCLISYIIWQFNPVLNFKKWQNKLTSIPIKTNKNEKGNRADEQTAEDDEQVHEDDQEKEESGLTLVKKSTPLSDPVDEPKPNVPFPDKIPSATGITLEVKNADTLSKSDGYEEKQEVVEMADTLADEEPYDPKNDLRDYKYPGIDLLEHHGDDRIYQDASELEANKDKIEETLSNYGIGIQKIFATVGPTVTLYEIIPEPGVRISKIKNLEDDIALSLAALGIRIIAPIPGKGTIGIEVPNKNKSIVSMRTLINSKEFRNSKYQLPIALGKRIDNTNFIADLTAMPHLLMAGATGQGKSVGLNAVIVSLLYKKHPSQIKFILIDPKKVELSIYRTIEKHFLAKLPDEEEAIVTDTKKVIYTLNALTTLMDIRYDLLKEAGTRNIKEYNQKFVSRKLNPQKGHKFLPFIVLVIDEFADLIMTAGKEVEMPIARLAQLARAVGIHLIIATQRPSVNIITGVIKANFPARIAFKVSSKIDSRTILDTGGADQLIGKGDMLVSYGGEVTRVQCAFVDTPEVDEITNFIGEQRGYPEAFLLPEYEEDGDNASNSIDPADRDARFLEAARLVVAEQIGSTSMLQRKMQLGYNRAGRIMDQLEACGVVGPSKGSKARDVLVFSEDQLFEIIGQ